MINRIESPNRIFHWTLVKSSLIRQKGECENGCFKKTKHAKFFKKRTFLTPWYAHVRTCAYQGVRNVRFLENLAYFIFLKHPFWDSPFCLITDQLCVIPPDMAWLVLIIWFLSLEWFQSKYLGGVQSLFRTVSNISDWGFCEDS